MTYGSYRRAAMTAAGFSLLIVTGGAEAQTRLSRDCRYEPHFPVAAPNWVDQNGCLRMRRGAGDVGVTGAIGRVEPVAPRGPVVVGNRPGSGTGRTGAGGVSPVTDEPIGRVGNVPNATTPIDRGNGGAPKGTNPTDRAGGAPKGTDPREDRGNGSAKNNNGLGNGYDPGDPGYVAGDPNTDLAKGVDPSNPGHGTGGPGKGGGKEGGGKGGKS